MCFQLVLKSVTLYDRLTVNVRYTHNTLQLYMSFRAHHTHLNKDTHTIGSKNEAQGILVSGSTRFVRIPLRCFT